MYKLKYFFYVRSYEARRQSSATAANQQSYLLRSTEFPEIAAAGIGTMAIRFSFLLVQIRRWFRKFI
jgi:hypothetical protein